MCDTRDITWLETDLANLNPIDAIVCSGCGFEGQVRQFYPDANGYYDISSEYEYAPRYCPQCGRMLVEYADCW